MTVRIGLGMLERMCFGVRGVVGVGTICGWVKQYKV